MATLVPDSSLGTSPSSCQAWSWLSVARCWFGKDASRLSRGEAALLAAVLPNPITRSAGHPSPGVRRRAAQIQAAMGQIEGLTGCVRR